MQKDKKLCLDLRHAFGSIASEKYKDCVSLYDQQKNEPKIIFPVGKYIAKKKMQSNQMDFIKLSDNIEYINCMCISPKKTHIVICQKIRNDEVVQLALYSLKKNQREKKYFKYYPRPQMSSNAIKALAFAPADPKLMIALTTQPDNLLLFIDISKARTMAQTQFKQKQISRISINPSNSYIVGISGKNFFKILRMEEQIFKVQHQNFNKLPKNRNFTEHVWYQNNKIILGTDKGQIYIINNNNAVSKSIISGFGQTSDNAAVNTISTFSKGFILGSSNGMFALWVKNQDSDQVYDEDQNLILLRIWKTNETRTAGVTCVSISSKQDCFVVAFDNNDIATFDLSQVIPTSYDAFDLTMKNKDKQLHFEYLYKGFHSGGISSMDICLHRPLIATCSKQDSTIRIWNYMDRKCQLVRQFFYKLDHDQGNPLLCLAFHPSGYYLAVGCLDKIRLFYVLNSQLRQYRQIAIKGCSQMRFSNGGNILAVSYPKPKYSSHLINLYSSYTLQFIIQFTGHSSPITDMVWSSDDSILISTGLDGNIIEWKIDQTSKIFNQNSSKYSSVLFNKSTGSIYAAGTQINKHVFRQIRIDRGKQRRQLTQKVFHLGSIRMSKMSWILSQFNHLSIISGYEDGSIKVYNSNFDSIPDQTINAHMGDIVRIAASPCGRYVFSVGEDGVLLIFQALDTNKDGTPLTTKHSQLVPTQKIQLNPFSKVCQKELADIVLIHRSQIDDALKQQKVLKANIEDLQSKIEFVVVQNQKKFRKEIESLRKQKEQQRRILVQKHNSQVLKLQQAIQKAAKTLDQQNDKHQTAISQIQSLYQRKLLLQWQKYQQLQSKLIEEDILHKQSIKGLQNQHQYAMEQLKQQFAREMKRVQKCYHGMEGAVTGLQGIYKTRLGLVQDQYQNQFQQIQQKWKNQDQEYDLIVSKLRNQNHQYQNRYQQKSIQLQKMIKQRQNMQNTRKNLVKDIQDLYKRIAEKNKQIANKDQMIKFKDNKLAEYMLKINDLQKSKQVLSFRVTEMRKSLEPKQGQIEKLKQELFRLQGEFEEMIKNMKQFNTNTQNLVKINKTLQDSLKKQAAKTKIKQLQTNKIIMQIHNCVKNDNVKQAITGIKSLYGKYFNQEARPNQQDPKALEQMIKQMNQLENTIYSLHHQSKKKIARRTRQVFKKTAQNSELISELNSLRKNYKKLNSQLQSKTKQYQNMLRELQRLKNQLARSNARQNKKSQKDISIDMEFNQPKLEIVQPSLVTKKKGKRIIKGTNFDIQQANTMQKVKLNEVMSQLQIVKMSWSNCQRRLKDIRDKVIIHLKNKGCKDQSLQTQLISFD